MLIGACIYNSADCRKILTSGPITPGAMKSQKSLPIWWPNTRWQRSIWDIYMLIRLQSMAGLTTPSVAVAAQNCMTGMAPWATYITILSAMFHRMAPLNCRLYASMIPRRRINFMVKKLLLAVSISFWVITKMGGFPFQWTSSRDNGATWAEVQFPNFISEIGSHSRQPVNTAIRDKNGQVISRKEVD